MDALSVERVRMSATSAARDAINRQEFIDGAAAVVGVAPELLSGEEEGALSFAGATLDLDASEGPLLVVDIGGGSTELVVGTTSPEGIYSMDVGCVRLTERWLHGAPPSPEELCQALSIVHDDLDEGRPELPAGAG